MISKSAGPCPAWRSRKSTPVAPGRTWTHSVAISFFSGRDGVDRLDLPAGGAHPGDARVHLEVDVPVVAPVAGGGVGLVGQRHRRRAGERRDPHRRPVLDEADPLAVGREERARRALGAGDRRRVELVEPPEPEAGARPRRARCTPARGRRARARCARRPSASGGCSVWFGRSARLNWVSGGAGAGPEPAPERRGRGDGERRAERRHEHAGPAAPRRAGRRGRRPAAAGSDTVDGVRLVLAAPRRTRPRWRTGRPGSFSSAVSTAASTCRGMVCRWGMSGRGLSVTTRATTACAVRAGERRLAGEHLVQHGAQRVDVGARR